MTIQNNVRADHTISFRNIPSKKKLARNFLIITSINVIAAFFLVLKEGSEDPTTGNLTFKSIRLLNRTVNNLTKKQFFNVQSDLENDCQSFFLKIMAACVISLVTIKIFQVRSEFRR